MEERRDVRTGMKIKIEVEKQIEEEEIVIRCEKIDERILRLQELLSNEAQQSAVGQRLAHCIVLHKGGTDYYVDMEEILFFETQSKVIYAHNKQNMWETEYKLYELEEMLPGYFMRISKSTIVNLNAIYAITKNISSSSKVEFEGTHKHAYVSRNYYKALTERLAERRQQKNQL